MVNLTEELAILIRTQFDHSGLTAAKTAMDNYGQTIQNLQAPKTLQQLKFNLLDAAKAGGKFIAQGRILETGLDTPGLKQIHIDLQNFGTTAAKVATVLPLMNKQMRIKNDLMKAGAKVDKAAKDAISAKTQKTAETNVVGNIASDIIKSGKSMAELKEKYKGFPQIFNNVKKAASDVLGKSLKDLIPNVKKLTGAEQKQAKMVNQMGLDYVGTGGQVLKANKNMTKSAAQMKKKFSMEYLGIMFGGMAVQRLFSRMAMTAKQDFMAITQGQGEAAKGFMGLDASIKLMRFSLGEALGTMIAQYLPAIIQISEVVSDWIQNNKKLTAAIVIGGLALGTFALILGQTVLFGQALMNVFGMKGLMGAFIHLATVNPILATIIALLALMAITVLSIPITREKFVNILSDSAEQLKKSVNNIIRLLFGSVSLKDTWVALGSIFVWIFAVIAGGLKGFLNGFEAVVTSASIVNRAIRLMLVVPIGLATDALLYLIDLFNQIPGIPDIDTSGVKKLSEFLADTAETDIKGLVEDFKGLWDSLAPMEDVDKIIAAGALGTYKEFKEEQSRINEEAQVLLDIINQTRVAIEAMPVTNVRREGLVTDLEDYMTMLQKLQNEGADIKGLDVGLEESIKSLQLGDVLKDTTDELNLALESNYQTNQDLLQQAKEENGVKTEKLDLLKEEIDLTEMYLSIRERYGEYGTEYAMAFEKAKTMVQTT